MSPYWSIFPDSDSLTLSGSSEDSGSDAASSILPLYYPLRIGSDEYGSTTDEEPVDVLLRHSLLSSASHQDSSQMTMLSNWTGTFKYGSLPPLTGGEDGQSSFTISSHHPDGATSGSRCDMYGPFTVVGTTRMEASQVTVEFRKTYIGLAPPKAYEICYMGTLTRCNYVDTLSGHWMIDHGSQGFGDFKFQQGEINAQFPDYPLRAILLFDRTPRTLWCLVLTLVIKEIHERWNKRCLYGLALDARRKLRRRYMELVQIQLDAPWNGSPPSDSCWTAIVNSIHPYDLGVWRALAMFQ